MSGLEIVLITGIGLLTFGLVYVGLKRLLDKLTDQDEP